jgi:hypothetical protein
VLGERKLNQNAMNSGVVVVLADMVKELCLRDSLRVLEQLTINTSLEW